MAELASLGCKSVTFSGGEPLLRADWPELARNDPRAFSYNRAFSRADLGPGCCDCAFGEICRGGCQSLGWATIGKFHHNAHCIFAASGRNTASE